METTTHKKHAKNDDEKCICVKIDQLIDKNATPM